MTLAVNQRTFQLWRHEQRIKEKHFPTFPPLVSFFFLSFASFTFCLFAKLLAAPQLYFYRRSCRSRFKFFISLQTLLACSFTIYFYEQLSSTKRLTGGFAQVLKVGLLKSPTHDVLVLAVTTLEIQFWNQSMIAATQCRVCIIRFLPTTH